MGKAKVVDGVRLSVLIPEGALKRLKIECIERQMLESSIVLEALIKHWAPAAPAIPVNMEPVWDYMTAQERSAVATRMLAAGQGEAVERFLKPFLEVDRGANALVQIFKAAGMEPPREAAKEPPEGNQ